MLLHNGSRTTAVCCQIAIATTLARTACSGDSDAPPEEAEAQASITRGLDNFSFNQGWRIDQHVRLVRDLNGDGLADVIGYGNGNVYTSLNQGINGFAAVTVALPGFGNDQGYKIGRASCRERV